jgi:ADP-ribosylglycohydrolase
MTALDRAQGCLLGQLAGDALGAQVESFSVADIRQLYPAGLRDLADGGSWNTLAGQPTDDSEMALALARMLVAHNAYDPALAREAYLDWFHSAPFDCGSTVRAGLCNAPNLASQANGALMRISPLGVFGSKHGPSKTADWARQDAAITHPNPVCQDCNALFAMAIAHAVSTGCSARDLYNQLIGWAADLKIDPSVAAAVRSAETARPADYVRQRGWVLIAFQNALFQSLHAHDLEGGVVDTVMHGGDTDTNAAIAGALLGAVYGREGVPERWTRAVLNCRPSADRPNVHHPRPQRFWPTDALELAAALIA